jgi:hypothetical protein
MEPRREEKKPEKPRPEEKQKRFRLIKLEERIAPKGGGKGQGGGVGSSMGACNTLSIE